MRNASPYDNAPSQTIAFETGANVAENVTAENPLPVAVVSGGGGGGAGGAGAGIPFRVINANVAGVSVGDLVVLTLSGSTESWYNLTTKAALATAPAVADLASELSYTGDLVTQGADTNPAPVAGISKRITGSTLTVNSTAATTYASGSVIGSVTGVADQSGLMTFSDVLRGAGLTATLMSIDIAAKANLALSLELWLFHQLPGASTINDRAAFALAAADIDKVATVIGLNTSNWASGGVNCSFAERAELARIIQSAGSDFYGCLVSRNATAIQFAAGTDVNKVTINVSQD